MKHLLLTLALATTGCALTSKSAPLDFRYFTLDEGAAPVQSASASAAPGKKLRLGSVNAAAHLRERMVYRDSPVELGYHEEERWSERPDAYVRRALTRALFEERGLEQVLGGGGYALDADLVALDEFTGDQPKVRVSIVFSLHDDTNVALETSLTAEKPIAKKGDPTARVEAFREALREVVTKLSDQVVGKLQGLPAVPGASTSEPKSALDEGGAKSEASDNCANLKGRELARCRIKQADPKAAPKAH